MPEPKAPSGELEERDDSESDIDESEAVTEDWRRSFYTIRIPTLVLLHIFTFGLFLAYWSYRHWHAQRRARGLPISPLGRALFSIVYVHQLFRMIDRGARATGVSPGWSPGSKATTFVVLILGSRLVGYLPLDDMSGIAAEFCLFAFSAGPLANAQRVANLANLTTPIGEEEEEDEDDEEEEEEEEEDEEDEEDEEEER